MNAKTSITTVATYVEFPTVVTDATATGFDSNRYGPTASPGPHEKRTTVVVLFVSLHADTLGGIGELVLTDYSE